MSFSCFSCYIIGHGTLPVQCGEILLAAGHEVCGIISADERVRHWAAQKSLTCFPPGTDLCELLRRSPFDYLFSIVNEHILNDEILALPRKLTINYHDAPLPRYAGTHATSWALINQEKRHGISWHIVSKQVDAGAVLKRALFDIVLDETAFSLNTKCYEAAIDSFTELVDELAADVARPVAQDIRERTFFARYRRPPRGCLIDWTRPAIEVAALVRALSFGPHPNPLGVPKFALGSEFVIPLQSDVLDSRSGKRPGTILALDANHVTVSTATNDLALRSFLTIEGQTVTAERLLTKNRLAVGDELVSPDERMCGLIETLVADCCRHEAFWVKRLATLQPLMLPYAKVGVAIGAAVEIRRIPMPLPEEVVRFLAKHTPENPGEALLAAWVAYLSRISSTGCFDLGFRAAVMRQLLGGLENLFASQVPLRVQFDGGLTFEGLLTRVIGSLNETRERKTFQRDITARYPTLKSSQDRAHTLPVAVEIVNRLHHGSTVRQGQLLLAIARDGTSCTWHFDTGAFPQDNVESMARQFGIFLRGLAAAPERSIDRQPLMSSEELHEILVEWNSASVEVPKDLCLHQLFEAQAQRTPDATALVWNHQRWSYRELNQRANRLAHYLRKQGAGAETLIGVCVRRSAEMLVGILGILKAGAAYVPLDPAYPVERQRFVLNDAKAAFLVTERELCIDLALEIQNCKLVCLDSDWETISKRQAENPVSGVTQDNLAYVIYTSGSTGKPKGVAIEHRSPVTLMHWAHTVFSSEECAGVLFATSVCFDLSIFEMFLPLSRGGEIILADNALQLPELPAKHEVTLVNTVPSAIRELVRMRGLPSSVRTVCLAGEPLLIELVQSIYGVPGVQKVYDLYGPSETTTYSTWVLRRADGPYTVGRPIANTQVYLLDANEQPVPIGLPGQIYIGGEGVARGYLHRPALTAERFVPDPFNPTTGRRLYRTGDLARYSDDGNIELLGRMDHQVKIRGFRIELGEVEEVLRTCAGVQDCVVVAREDVPGEKRLVAYVSASKDELPTMAEMRNSIQKQLPEFMVPAAFVRLNALPQTPNGKVDRRALPKPDSSLLAERASFVPCRDAVERRVAGMWEEILGVPQIGRDDDYFELGGDSLQAVRLFAQVEDTFHKKLGLATLFQASTVGKLAEILRTEAPAEKWSLLVPIQPKGSNPPFFCIHARGGNVLFYRDLARRLGEDQPVYGIQAQGLDRREPYLTRVEDMAARYIREIKRVQPKGPYFLGGSSFGGTAAFEMAQQLRTQGEEVALLAIFDTGGPGYPKMIPVSAFARLWQNAQTVVRRIQHYAWALRTLDRGQRIPYVREKSKKIKNNFKRWRIRLAGTLPASLSNAFFPTYVNARANGLKFERAIGGALANYRHQPYAGRMTLFRASRQPIGIYPDPELGWNELVKGGLEIHEVPGNHGTIVVEPGVRFLAEKLKFCIVEARASAIWNASKRPPFTPSAQSDRADVRAVTAVNS